MASRVKKFISFSLAGEQYAMPLSAGSRFVACQKVVPVPNSLEHILGLFYHSGQLITVLDLAGILKSKKSKECGNCLLFNYQDEDYGVLVDEGSRVVQASRTVVDRKKKKFKKYIRVDKEKIYVLEPEEILQTVGLYD